MFDALEDFQTRGHQFNVVVTISSLDVRRSFFAVGWFPGGIPYLVTVDSRAVLKRLLTDPCDTVAADSLGVLKRLLHHDIGEALFASMIDNVIHFLA